MPFRSEEAIQAINDEHCKQIKERMSKILEDLGKKPDVVSEEDAGPEDLRNMLQLAEDQSTKYLSIKEVMDSADEQHNAVLDKPWYVSEESNRGKVMAEYILENCESLIKKVPLRCKEFDLLVSQRIAVMAMTSPLPKETFTEVHITRESMTRITGLRARKVPFSAAFNVEEGVLSSFTIADYW